jgi:anti-sigma B factor antagonist
MIRVEVGDGASAKGLVERLAGACEPTSVVVDIDRREVRVEENGQAVAQILRAIEVWLEDADADSTTVWLDGTQYTLVRQPTPSAAGRASGPAKGRRPSSGTEELAARTGASAKAIVDFSVKVEPAGNSRTIVALRGEVDMYAAPAAERELRGVIDAGAREVIVDLGVLTAVFKQLDALGGRISIVCGNPNVTKVFEITGLDNVFAINGARDLETRKKSVV